MKRFWAAIGSAMLAQAAVAQGVPGAEARKAAEPGRVVAPAPGETVSITPRPDGMDVRIGQRLERITALANDIVRVRIGLTGQLPADESWAVLDTARHGAAKARAIAHGFAAGSLVVTIDPSTGRLTVSDTSNRTLYRETAVPSTRDSSGFQLVQQMPEDAHYFGLGDKAGPLDRRGEAFTIYRYLRFPGIVRPSLQGDPFLPAGAE
jgi:alpha-glucosidase